MNPLHFLKQNPSRALFGCLSSLVFYHVGYVRCRDITLAIVLMLEDPLLPTSLCNFFNACFYYFVVVEILVDLSLFNLKLIITLLKLLRVR
jgi:hypothetical protein